MGDVYSMHTKKQLGKQDTSKNDEMATKGVYLGCLPKEDADTIRIIQSKLAIEEAQVNELIEAFDYNYLAYLQIVTEVLLFFKSKGIDNFDPTVNDLMVGEDGHTWIHKKGEV